MIARLMMRRTVFSRLAAMTLYLLLTLAAPAVAQERERLTGHGTALVTITSGGTTTEGVRLDIDFRAARDRSVEFTGNFRVAAASETRAVVVIDRATYTLERITADPPFVVDTTSRPFTLSSSAASVAVRTSSGRETTFEGGLTFSGDEGGPGTPLSLNFRVGQRGEQGSIQTSGTWETPPGVKFLPVIPTDCNALLKGRYSGEIHGATTASDSHHAIVLVIEFDGNGGVTGGRFIWNTTLNHDVRDIVNPSAYQVDTDGFGDLKLCGGPGFGCVDFHIAVFDNGKGVKIGALQPPASHIAVTGELRKQ